MGFRRVRVPIEHGFSSMAWNGYSCRRYAGRLAGFARRHKRSIAKRGGHAAGRCAEHGRALPRCSHTQGPSNVCYSPLKPCTALSCGPAQAPSELVPTVAPALRTVCLSNEPSRTYFHLCSFTVQHCLCRDRRPCLVVWVLLRDAACC